MRITLLDGLEITRSFSPDGCVGYKAHKIVIEKADVVRMRIMASMAPDVFNTSLLQLENCFAFPSVRQVVLDTTPPTPLSSRFEHDCND